MTCTGQLEVFLDIYVDVSCHSLVLCKKIGYVCCFYMKKNCFDPHLIVYLTYCSCQEIDYTLKPLPRDTFVGYIICNQYDPVLFPDIISLNMLMCDMMFSILVLA